MLFFCQTIFHQGKDNSFFNFTSRGQGQGKRYNAFHLSTKLGYCCYYNYQTNYELLGLILAQTMFLLLYGKLRHFFHKLFFSSLPLPKVLCLMAATVATSLTQFYDIEGKKARIATAKLSLLLYVVQSILQNSHFQKKMLHFICECELVNIFFVLPLVQKVCCCKAWGGVVFNFCAWMYEKLTQIDIPQQSVAPSLNGVENYSSRVYGNTQNNTVFGLVLSLTSCWNCTRSQDTCLIWAHNIKMSC